MALKDIALFLYGFQITNANRYIPFKNESGGDTMLAVLNLGNYTATEFMAEMKRAMELVDGTNRYIWTIDRTYSGGRENRVSVDTTSDFLSIMFGSDPNASNSPRDLIGFNHSDYTGALTYMGAASAGTILIPDFATYNYTGPDEKVESDGVKNVSTNGIKETLVFAQVQFFQGEWMYITNFNNSTQKDKWVLMLKYLIKQLKLEFSPSIYEDPTVFYECTLESTPADSNGMKYELQLQVSEGLYRFYKTGLLKFRLNTVIT